MSADPLLPTSPRIVGTSPDHRPWRKNNVCSVPNPRKRDARVTAAVQNNGGSGRRVLIKICCISSIQEAELALDLGADLLGLVSAMPSGPGVIDEDAIVRIRSWIGSRARTVLLTSRLTVEGVREQIVKSRPDMIQLTDEMPVHDMQVLRASVPGVAIMPVIHIQDATSVTQAMEFAPHADALLLDSGNPAAAIKELGGTGRVHDWRLSRAIREAVAVPVFLAGGLHADNVSAAIATVRPAGVDVCSGVRIAGALDEGRLRAFVTNAREV